ncbi:MAG: MFS transporter [Lysobacteraceae bacterium]
MGTTETTDAAPAAGPSPSPLRSRAFVALMAYRLFTILSYQIVAVTVGWHIYELTRDPWKLGLVGLAEVLPFFAVAPFAGHLVDHLPKRRLGIVACLGLAITPALLLAIAQGWLHADAPRAQAWMIYGAIVFTGAVRSFLGPVYNTLFARALPRDRFTRGSSIGAVVFQGALVLGPAIGGVLIGVAGKSVAYATGIAVALAAAGALGALRVSEPPPAEARGPVFASIAEGLRFVFSQQVMLGAMALDMFSVLLGGAVSMLPAFIKDVLHAGPDALGFLRAAPALGSVCVALWLARHPLERNAGRILLLAVAGFGICTIAFALSRHLLLSFAILLAYGVCDGISVVLRSTILQLVTPDHMRGRVSSINSIFISSSNELGAFYDGVMARAFGLIHAVVIGGCVTLGVVGITAWRAPKLRDLDLRDLH